MKTRTAENAALSGARLCLSENLRTSVDRHGLSTHGARAATTKELIRVLSYAKFKLSSADRDELLADYLPYCTTVTIPGKAPKIPSCRDPGDLPFLHLAAHAKADFLVTGDRDLLDIRDKTRFAIVTAEAFISKLEKL